MVSLAKAFPSCGSSSVNPLDWKIKIRRVRENTESQEKRQRIRKNTESQEKRQRTRRASIKKDRLQIVRRERTKDTKRQRESNLDEHGSSVSHGDGAGVESR